MSDVIKTSAIIVGAVCVVFGLVYLTAIGGQETGRKRERAEWQQELVKRGFAEYNATTGEWQWKGNSDADR